MARQIRIEYPGAFYHVMARGDRREPIVHSDRDRHDFVDSLSRACRRTGWRVHAWVLMNNHYHWLLETPEPNLVEGMRWFQNTYTRRFNHRNRLWGHLFGGRYRAILVEGKDGDGDYFGSLMDYIHLNPVRAGLIDAQAGLGLLDYRWSSLARGYGVAPSKRPGFLETGQGFSHFGMRDVAAGRRKFLKRLEDRAMREGEAAGSTESDGQGLQVTLKRGWYWGSEAFRERLLDWLKTNASRKVEKRDHRLSAEGQAHREDQAEKLIAACLVSAGLLEKELLSLPGSDPRKVDIAERIWGECSISQKWIAQRLGMKSPGNVSLQLHKRRKRRKE